VNYSPHACQRALKTVNKQCLKSSEQALKQFNALCQKEFACETDTGKALMALEKQLKMTSLHHCSVNRIARFNKKGRPVKEAKPRLSK